MRIQNTLTPHKTLDNHGIQYSVCQEYNHISRYRCLRKIVHGIDEMKDRFVTHETSNAIESNVEVVFHIVTYEEENRLDLIAYNYLGNPTYAWVIAYLNDIEDGYTIMEGMTLQIPKNIYTLFNAGEMLQSIPPTMLNLGSE